MPKLYRPRDLSQYHITEQILESLLHTSSAPICNHQPNYATTMKKYHPVLPTILVVTLSAASIISIQIVASQDLLDRETRNLDRNLWTVKSNYRLFPKKRVANVDNDDYNTTTSQATYEFEQPTISEDNGLLATEEIPSHEISSRPLFPGWTVEKDDTVDAEERNHKETTDRDQEGGYDDDMIKVETSVEETIEIETNIEEATSENTVVNPSQYNDKIVKDEELADWFNYTRSDCFETELEPVVTNSRRLFLRHRNLESKGHKSSKAWDEDHTTKSKSSKKGSKASKSNKSWKSSVKCTDPPKEMSMDTQMPSMKPSEETSIIPVNEKKQYN